MRSWLLLPLVAAACGLPTAPADPTDSAAASTSPPTGPGGSVDDSPADTAQPQGAEVRLFINELMPANGGALEVDGETPDWIELYNPGEVDVALDGYTVTDDLEDPSQHRLDPSLVVPAGGFLLLYADGGSEGAHLGFKLSGDGEAVGLFFPDGSPADALRFGTVPSNLALARTTDGDPDWVMTSSATPGAPNDVD